MADPGDSFNDFLLKYVKLYLRTMKNVYVSVFQNYPSNMRYYFMNWFGLKVGDEEIEQIDHPKAEIMTHVTFKTLQTGILVGSVLVAPALCYREGKLNKGSLTQRAYNCGAKGLLWGAVMGPFMAYKRLKTQPLVCIYDRAYRLRCNRNQLSVDRYSILGTLMGVGYAFYNDADIAHGALFGFGIGCVSAGVLNYVYDTVVKLEAAI